MSSRKYNSSRLFNDAYKSITGEGLSLGYHVLNSQRKPAKAARAEIRYLSITHLGALRMSRFRLSPIHARTEGESMLDILKNCVSVSPRAERSNETSLRLRPCLGLPAAFPRFVPFSEQEHYVASNPFSFNAARSSFLFVL